MLLRLLEDKNGEVQNLAVKCLAPLIKKVKDPQVPPSPSLLPTVPEQPDWGAVEAEQIVDALCANMVGEAEELRDVSSIALKTLIGQLPPAAHHLTANIVKRVTPRSPSSPPSSPKEERRGGEGYRIANAMALEPKAGDVSVKLEALDILADILLRYGALMAPFHAQVEETLMPELASARLAVRKRAMVALAHLVPVCSSALFDKIMGRLEAELKSNASLSTTRTFVATTAAVSRASGHRFAEWIPKVPSSPVPPSGPPDQGRGIEVVPILLQFCSETEDDELRESCLAAFEAFVLRCPKEMSPWLTKLSELCGAALKHDPNYHYDDAEEAAGEGMELEDGDGDEDGEEGEEYSDDDDVSWKVRRGAAKTLEALVWSRRDLLPQLLKDLGPLLIGRFKEREENVKGDIFHAYAALLRQAGLSLPPSAFPKPSSSRIANGDHNGALPHSEAELSPDQVCPFRLPILWLSIGLGVVGDGGAGAPGPGDAAGAGPEPAAAGEVAEDAPGGLRPPHGAHPRRARGPRRPLRPRHARRRARPQGEARQHEGLTSSSHSLTLKGEGCMELDTLSFLRTALEWHEAAVFGPFMERLVPLATAASSDSFYKVAAQALAVLQGLVPALRPLAPPQRKAWLTLLYDAVFSRLKATDIDQVPSLPSSDLTSSQQCYLEEVKEKAIAAMGELLASFGEELSGQVPTVLPLLLDRLRNEMTRYGPSGMRG